MNWSALSRFISLHRCVTFFNDVMYNEQTRWCTFGYAFFSQSIQDHKLWSLSFFIFPCLKKASMRITIELIEKPILDRYHLQQVSTHSIQVICDQIGHFWWMMSQIWTVIIWYNYVFVKKYERTEEIVLW